MSSELLERKEYLVGITIFEGRNIQGKDSQGTSDPFLKIRCADQVQQSQKKYEQNSAVWNQSLTFNGLHMNQYELETFEMIIELYDHNAVFRNEIIGQYSIGLSTLYRSLNHEFYKTWVGVFNPEEPNMVQGYLLISCFIVGPNERPPIHAADEDNVEEQGSDEEDEEAVARRIENIKRAQGIVQINSPGVIEKCYQLSVVAQKAENLPLCTNEAVSPFVSVRVNGCVLTTNTTKGQDAVFGRKLMFPITYPILNDKITVRIWSKNGGFSANTFIANIPEHPSETDNFNLSKLLSQDGRMAARWFNLYGTHPSERSAKTKGRREGSSYLGRVLMQFALIPNDKPALMVQHSNNPKEPRQGNYQLLVDLYEWINCEMASDDKSLWVSVTQGGAKSEPQLAKKNKKSTGNNSYIFPVKKVEELLVDFPVDFDQIPDIIINFYCISGSNPPDLDNPAKPVERVGYLRINPMDVTSKNPKPQWLRIKTPTNDLAAGKPGQILMNVMFLRYNPLGGNPDRPFKDKSGKQVYKFYQQILTGFEIATAIPSEDLNLRCELQLGGSQAGRKLRTQQARGRYPKWNYFSEDDIYLEKEIAFESDLKISVINVIPPKGPFQKKEEEKVIGELSVVLSSLMKQCDRPQFFNIINEEEQFVGSILANFFLKHYPKNLKKKKEKVDEKHKEIIDKFKNILKPRTKVDLKFSLFGLRNLINAAIKPEITIGLSDDRGEKIQLENGHSVGINDVMTAEERKEFNQKWREAGGAKWRWSKVFDFTQDQADNQEGRQKAIQGNVGKDDGQGLKVETVYKGGEQEVSHDPNIGEYVELKGIPLEQEPLLWPFITVSVKDQARTKLIGLGGKKGCEDCFTTLSLLEYAADAQILEDQELFYARAQLNKNQDCLNFVQEQIQVSQFLAANNYDGAYNMRDLVTDQEGLGDNAATPGDDGTILTKGQRGTHAPRNTDVRSIEQGKMRPTQAPADDAGLFVDVFGGHGRNSSWLDKDDINFTLGGMDMGGGQENEMEFGSDDDANEENMAFNIKKQGAVGDALQRQLDTGIIAGTEYKGISQLDEFFVGRQHKEQEKEERTDMRRLLKSEMVEYQKKLDKLGDNDINKQRVIQMRMMERADQIDELDNEEMTESKFWGLIGMEAGDDDFDYGRDFLKEQTYDEKLNLPYQQLPLFLQSDWFKGVDKKQVQVGGMLRSGYLSGATLKAKLTLTEREDSGDENDEGKNKMEEENEYQDYVVYPDDGNGSPDKSADITETKEVRSKYQMPEIDRYLEMNLDQGTKKYENIQKLLECFTAEVPFNLSEQPYMDVLQKDLKTNYRVRVYIISCQNLSAMSSVIDLKSRLAGMTALCTANPYPVITVGDGNNDNEERLMGNKQSLKKYDGYERAVEDELSPQFLMMQELDMQLPKDWKLEISIYDKSKVGRLGDKLIGLTVIDLENRRHGDPLMQCQNACDIEAEKLRISQSETGKKKGEKSKTKAEIIQQQLRTKFMRENKAYLQKMSKKLKQIEQVIIPIEYRELLHPMKSQTQGILECWTEIFTDDDARKIPVSKMKVVKEETYEIRIVIWETREIPLVDGDSVDIFVRCTFDPTGWSKDEVALNTDTHMSSKDGHGQFNWRMKFTLKVPCDFPRLKFQVLDAGVVSDEAIGETTLNLRSTVKKVQGLDSLSVPKSFVAFTNPCDPEEERGMMLFSLDILTKEDADQDPVGLGQDEPNHDPVLVRPTAGRGLGDALASVGFKAPSLDWNPFGKFLYPAIFAAVMGTILTFAVVLK